MQLRCNAVTGLVIYRKFLLQLLHMGAQERSHQTLVISLGFIYDNIGKELSDSHNKLSSRGSMKRGTKLDKTDLILRTNVLSAHLNLHEAHNQHISSRCIHLFVPHVNKIILSVPAVLSRLLYKVLK